MPFEKMIKSQYLIILLVVGLACKNKQANQTECNEIKQIIITDKISRTSGNKKTVFTDNTVLLNFCREIKDLQLFPNDPIVRANYGFYLLDVHYQDGEESTFDIIYTKYNGVIIRYQGKYYKNDELDSLIIGYLSPKEWQG